jgi:dTDP-4-dehydrorhamnose 3,5-epimerase
MEIQRLVLEGAFLVKPSRFGDPRGFFSETFRASAMAEAGVREPFVQDNHARSPERGTLRGMHFQAPPFGQGKLVRCCRGAILDVIVDLRTASPTFGRTEAVELSAENWTQIFAPVGVAHGYVTLTDDCEVLYKTTSYYAPQAEGGLLWSDPALGVDWRMPASEIKTNARDSAWPRLADLNSPF